MKLYLVRYTDSAWLPLRYNPTACLVVVFMTLKDRHENFLFTTFGRLKWFFHEGYLALLLWITISAGYFLSVSTFVTSRETRLICTCNFYLQTLEDVFSGHSH